MFITWQQGKRIDLFYDSDIIFYVDLLLLILYT